LTAVQLIIDGGPGHDQPTTWVATSRVTSNGVAKCSPRKEERMAERSIAAPDSAEVARLRRGFLGQLMLPDQDGYHRL
jgi:hypothetical protein